MTRSATSGVMTRGGAVGKKPPVKVQKSFTRSMPEWNYLLQLLETGEVDPNEKPSQIRTRHEQFHKFTTSQFRGAWNKAKTELGVHVRDVVDKGAPPPMLGEISRNTLHEDEDDEEDEETISPSQVASMYGNSTAGGGEMKTLYTDSWMPLYHIVEWCDTEGRDRMTVLVLMPSGVNESFRFSTVDDGNQLEIAVTLPLAMHSMEELMKPLRKKLEAGKKSFTGDTGMNYVLKTNALRRYFAELTAQKDHRMLCKCKIKLPKKTTGQTEESLFLGKGNSIVLVVDLWVYRKDQIGVKFGGGMLLQS